MPWIISWPVQTYCNCISNELFVFTYWLEYLNSFVNSVVLVFGNAHFRKKFYSCMVCAYCKGKRRVKFNSSKKPTIKKLIQGNAKWLFLEVRIIERDLSSFNHYAKTFLFLFYFKYMSLKFKKLSLEIILHISLLLLTIFLYTQMLNRNKWLILFYLSNFLNYLL